MKTVDLFVIGGGSGGVRAARIAAGHGARVALAESSRVGGTCVIRGCIPKKLMVLASRYGADFDDAAGYGWSVGPRLFDWRRLRQGVAAEVSRLEAVYTAGLERAGVTLRHERAVIDDHGVVALASGERVRARHILIATGSCPADGAGLEGSQLASTSDDFFGWSTQPDRVLVQGAGYIALELACLLQRLGSQVTLAMRGQTVLRGFDDGVREHLQQALVEAGVNVLAGRTLSRIGQGDNAALEVTLSDGSVHTVDAVLRATGRTPNTQSLGLERVGVSTAADGSIVVDEWSGTSVPGVHAVGDVTGRVMLTPAAIREGHALADTLFGTRRVAIDHALVPTAVFTTPEIGAVGLSERQAAERYRNVDVYEARFAPMKAALSGRSTRMLMKVIVDRSSDRVLGVHLVGPEAAEMIQLAGVALQMGVSKAQWDATLPVHPTAGEELLTMRSPVRRHG